MDWSKLNLGKPKYEKVKSYRDEYYEEHSEDIPVKKPLFQFIPKFDKFKLSGFEFKINLKF